MPPNNSTPSDTPVIEASCRAEGAKVDWSCVQLVPSQDHVSPKYARVPGSRPPNRMICPDLPSKAIAVEVRGGGLDAGCNRCHFPSQAQVWADFESEARPKTITLLMTGSNAATGSNRPGPPVAVTGLQADPSQVQVSLRKEPAGSPRPP